MGILDAPSAPALVGGQKPVRKGNLVLNVKDYGAVGDGVGTDTAAIAAAIAAAKALVGGVATVWVYFPRGTYPTTRFTVPGGVALRGDGYTATRLKNSSTDGLVFITLRGSNSFVRGMFIDGQMGAQTVVGLAAVQFSRPNALNAARNVAGGVVLSAAAAAGATSVSVTSASPGGEAIRPDDIITVIDPGTTPLQYEMLRVSESYVPGSLTLPLKTPAVYAHAVTALCSVASTNVGINDCKVLGNGRDGIAFWHVIHGYAKNNVVMDYQDTGIDCPAGGSRYVDIHHNYIETQGRWGMAFDSTPAVDADLGRVADCTSSHNSIVFLPGGSYTSGNTIDGIYFGNADRCSSINDKFNLERAGLAGVTYSGTSTGCRVVNPDVKGAQTIRANTFGVRHTTAGPVTVSVDGGRIQYVSMGVDANLASLGMVRNVNIHNVTSYAVNMSAATYVQRLCVVGCNTDTNVAGVRCGGAPATGSKATVTASVLLNSSFAPTVFDTGWTSTLTANM